MFFVKKSPSLFIASVFKNVFFVAVAACLFASCKKLDVFEKNISVPQYKWQYQFQPDFEFSINDTAANYKIFIILRHTDAYRYNNIWLNIATKNPGDSSYKTQRFDLQLGADATGWEGAGMDDIWELRKSITNGPVKFTRPGNYKFKISHIMRENPLPNILSVGVRVEKVR